MKIVFSDVSDVIFVTEINMAEYGDGRSTCSRDTLSACYCDAIYRRVLLFVCSMNHMPPNFFFLSGEDDDDVRNIGKHDFRSVLLHPMLSNANLLVISREL